MVYVQPTATTLYQDMPASGTHFELYSRSSFPGLLCTSELVLYASQLSEQHGMMGLRLDSLSWQLTGMQT